MIPKLIATATLFLSMSACSPADDLPTNTYVIGKLPGRIGTVMCVEGYKFHHIRGFNDRYVQVFELDEYGNEVPARCGPKPND